jgi:hypothetical protein
MESYRYSIEHFIVQGEMAATQARILIERLSKAGRDTSEAESRLAALERQLRDMNQLREQILKGPHVSLH